MFEVLLVVLGTVIGVIGTTVYVKRSSVGILRIDQSDPTDAPYLFLDLDQPVESFMNKKSVRFRICKKNFLSHE